MGALRCMSLRAWPALVALATLCAPALAAQRVALVIGNATYAHAPLLANPLNDATDIGAALDRLGFSVTTIENADYAALRRGLLEFQQVASVSEMAVVFYAGHGIEVDQRNFLVPVDARLESDRDVDFEAVPLDLVQRTVESASGLRLVILDACRENPFAAKMRRAGATRSIGRGLARVEPSGETLIAYAAKQGTVALDGTGRNSPYTKALLAHLEEPSVEVMYMFRKVRDAVLAATGNQQEPFWYGSLSSRRLYLAGEPAPVTAPPAEPAPVIVSGAARVTAEELAVERVYWESVKESDDPADIRAYLKQFHGGMFEALAYNRLERLEAVVGPSTEPESGLPATQGQEPSSIAHRIPDFSILHLPTSHSMTTGTFTGADGSRYEGEHLYGEAQGRGTYTWADGARYKGRFRDSKLHGRGTYTSPDGRSRICEWHNNAVASKTCEYHEALAYNRLERLEAVVGPSTEPESGLPATQGQEPSSIAHRIPDFSILHLPTSHSMTTGTFTGADQCEYH